MKCRSLIFVVFAIAVMETRQSGAQTQSAPIGTVIQPPTIIRREAHQRVWQSVSLLGIDGRQVLRTNSYIELRSGMNVYDPVQQQWTEASDEIEVPPGDGALVARKAQHEVIFSSRLKPVNGPTIDLLMADGKRLQSTVAGIAFTDTAIAKSVFLAEAQDTGGVLLGTNEVVYPGAFAELNADLRYSMRVGSFEQDVVLHEQLPFPDELVQAGFKPETTLVEVWTSFTTTNPPNRRPIIVNGQEVPGDQNLDFGTNSMFFAPSQVYIPSDGRPLEAPVSPRTHAAKEWVNVQGQDFLVESISFAEFKQLTAALPQPQARLEARPDVRRKLLAQEKGKRHGSRPLALYQMAANPLASRQVAQAPPKARLKALKDARSVVWDYILVSGSWDYRFDGNQTYYVTGDVSLNGHTTMIGGTCVKFTHCNTNWSLTTPRLSLYGTVNCATETYRPAVFTAVDDQTVGAIISGSASRPDTNYYAYAAIWLAENSSDPIVLQNLQIRYAHIGIEGQPQPLVDISHAQFVNCYVGAIPVNATMNTRNVLFANVGYPFWSYASTVNVENATFDQGIELNGSGTASSYYFTNCLATGFTTVDSYGGINNQVLSSASGVYQTVGGGTHYLASGSPYRNAGSTNINAQLLTDLACRTTYPPIVLSNPFLTTTLVPQAQRIKGLPALGFSYPALDYLISNVCLTNATLTLANGVAVGYTGTNGIQLFGGGSVVSQGTPLCLNRLVNYGTVQDSALATSQPYAHAIYCGGTYSPPPTVQLRFTGLSTLASENASAHIYAPFPGPMTVSVQDSMIGSGSLFLYGTNSNLSVSLINNTIDFVDGSYGGNTLTLFNNDLYAGSAAFNDYAGQSFTVKDNLIDQTVLSNGTNATWTLGYNAYSSGYTRLTPTNATDVVLSPPNYAWGPLGDWYTTGLVDKGSRLAAAAGLYHYTTRSDQTPEASSTVDIGFHFVALDAYGNPLDSDSVGIPDYLQDANGNGTVDSGETDWLNAADGGLKVIITEPKPNANVP